MVAFCGSVQEPVGYLDRNLEKNSASRSRSWLPAEKGAAASCRTSTGSRYAVGCFQPKRQHLLGECRSWALTDCTSG